MEQNKNTGAAIGGIVFTGCLFIGAAIGMALDKTKIGGAFGMGVGFLAMGAIWAYYAKKSNK